MSDNQYVKSVTHSKRFLQAVEDLKEQLKGQRAETRINNKHLSQITELAKSAQEEKIVQLEQEIVKMKEDLKWADTSAEPAIDLTPDHLMKKLNIL
ncbi:MAG: hypothetical protein CME62_12665 [Halobacteriovoraceae bacterium]|nr:hypothetical protein [Halobacteriovoraceae bacterium]|tara:strand:- start:25285 stop:25572 length:288 start_codon:yes stop_codon:yes gene_type:complete